jgi:hypothetical protein
LSLSLSLLQVLQHANMPKTRSKRLTREEYDRAVYRLSLEDAVQSNSWHRYIGRVRDVYNYDASGEPLELARLVHRVTRKRRNAFRSSYRRIKEAMRLLRVQWYGSEATVSDW